MKMFSNENIGFSACDLTYIYVKRPLISHRQPHAASHLTYFYVKRHHLSPNPQPAYFENNTYEQNQSHSHPDHLGSTSFITNTFGYDQRNNYSSRYTFSAKEKDNETGYSYFGARYYDSDLSVWISADPESELYPETSPYMFVLGNSINQNYPNGMWVIDRIVAQQGDNEFTLQNFIGRITGSTITVNQARDFMYTMYTGSPFSDIARR